MPAKNAGLRVIGIQRHWWREVYTGDEIGIGICNAETNVQMSNYENEDV